MNQLRVAIDARLEDGAHGGVQQYILGLIHGLGKLVDGDEEYVLLTYEGQDEWLRPYLTDRFALLPEQLAPGNAMLSLRQRAATAMPLARKMWRALPYTGRPTPLPHSDGRIEAIGASVIHFPKQSYFTSLVPSIFQPHDLQHIHLPEFFSPRERLVRDYRYRGACEHASLVVASSSWVSDDLVRQYGLAVEKVVVIPPAPVLGAYPNPIAADIYETKTKFGLPERFMLYPAQTWPHKNHVALVKALDLLRGCDGGPIHLVFSGRRNADASLIDREVRALNLESQVHFTGFVTPLELQALYRLATGVIIPTRFEAASFPMWEAFLAGVPVACSNVTSLPMQAGNAALVFDPDNVSQIAEAMYRLWTDIRLRHQLIEAGRKNVSRFSWERTALNFRARYRSLAGRDLSAEDQALVNEAPIL
jgi:glycosyltransferase involved in cell wall biosynthesis